MKTKEFFYQESKITFTIGDNSDVKVNGNEMSKVFDKDVQDFLNQKVIKDFVRTYIQFEKESNSENNSFSKQDILYTEKKSGIYLDKVLAIKLATWLDPKFEIWIIKTMESLKFSHYSEHLKALSAQQQEILYFEKLCREAATSQNELAIQIIKSHRRLEQFRNDKGNALRKKSREVRNNLFTQQGEE
jgi:hypothetical protein